MNVRAAMLATWLLLGAPLAAQWTVSGPGGGGGGGGGASALGDLTDVTLTAPADGDTLERVSGVFINRNLLTAIGGQIGVNGAIPYVTTSQVLASTGMIYDASSLNFGSTGASRGPRMRMNTTGSCSAGASYSFRNDPTSGLISDTASTLGVCLGGVLVSQFGGDQTLLVKNATATTGVTTVNIDGGDGQGTNTLLAVRPTGTHSTLRVSGNFVFGEVTAGGNRSWQLSRNTATNGNVARISAQSQYAWSSIANAVSAGDTGLARHAAAVVKATNGSAGFGQFYAASFRSNPDGTARPTCDVNARGTYWQTYGATSVADVVAVCSKNSADAYGWRDLQAGSGAAVFAMSGTAEYRAFPLDAGAAATLTAIACTTDVATSTIDLDVTYGSFATAGTAVTSATIECGTTRTEVTSFAAAAIPAGTLVRFATSAPVNDPTQVLIEAYWSVP